MTDDIAGISGGTVIKYKDYICGYEVSIYGDIIGCKLITSTDTNIWCEGIIIVQGNVIKAAVIAPAGNINVTVNEIYTIRVYYI